ncbi:Hypothetical predicted protein [Marmota monax]|uniref:Uncharacterized protein n=1 Tax=Marmota monax TaxID=9995 RepID=A0A5E4A7I1_MARMO|nr:hypothetical protein GHT09_019081 [Marmota monax]VTJ53078.1 Hypothetical predicted protein [Marmota monax]
MSRPARAGHPQASRGGPAPPVGTQCRWRHLTRLREGVTGQCPILPPAKEHLVGAQPDRRAQRPEVAFP